MMRPLSAALGPLLALGLLSPSLVADGCPGEPTEPPDDICTRTLAPEGSPRHLVISRPYGSGGSQANTFEVLGVGADGALSRGQSFTMGRSVDGEIAFTPDGQIGIAVQEDGSLGVFSLDADGNPTVIHARYDGDFYAEQVLIGEDGDRAYVVDPNWRENGGGIYGVWIHCDGHLSDMGLLTPSKLAYQLRPIPGAPGEAFLAARDFGEAPAAFDGYRLSLGDTLDWESGGDAFGDEEGIFSAAAVTFDGAFGLIGDNNLFSGTGNRLGAVDLNAGGGVQVIEDVEDPVAIAFSPFGGSGIVVSGFGDAIFTLSYTPASSRPFSVLGPLAYAGARPQLPASLAMITRGPLTGHVYVAENTAVRRVAFTPGGGVTDIGPFDLGAGYTSISGAIGIQP